MYKNVLKIVCCSLLFSAIACQEDAIVADNISTNSNPAARTAANGIEIIDGRLHFNTKEELNSFFQKAAEVDDADLHTFFDPLYAAGFISLIPVVTEATEESLYQRYLPIVPHNPRYETDFDVFEDIEKVIGDEVFAGMLNFDGEIWVENRIYKYTDAGLFIVPDGKSQILYDFLDRNSISKSLATPTDRAAAQRLMAQVPCQQLYSFTADISYAPTYDCSGGGGYTSSSTYTPASTNTSNTDPSYAAFLSNLSNCQPDSGLFGNLFGDNHVCIDKYERRRRVKTKAFNYNYLVVYHLGVKVHHQYKGWTGFWRTEKADELRLNVEAAQFEYNPDQLLNNTIIYNASIVKEFYTPTQRVTYDPGAYFNNYHIVAVPGLPQVFKSDLSFEFFSTGISWLDTEIQNGINSNLSAKHLNEQFYSTIFNTAKSHMQSALGASYSMPATRTFAAKFPQNGKLIIQKSVVRTGLNIGVMERTFDWGAEIKFGMSANGSADSWTFSGGAGNQLIRPKHFRVKMIGAARRGSGWHGSKFNVGIN